MSSFRQRKSSMLKRKLYKRWIFFIFYQEQFVNFRECINLRYILGVLPTRPETFFLCIFEAFGSGKQPQPTPKIPSCLHVRSTAERDLSLRGLKRRDFGGWESHQAIGEAIAPLCHVICFQKLPGKEHGKEHLHGCLMSLWDDTAHVCRGGSC